MLEPIEKALRIPHLRKRHQTEIDKKKLSKKYATPETELLKKSPKNKNVCSKEIR